MSELDPRMKVYVVNIPYEDKSDSKIRPALVLSMSDGYIKLLKVTSDYDKKPEKIKELYYPIIEWQQAGLKKESYVDCHRTYNITTDYILRNKPVAKLTVKDKVGLHSFVKNLVDTGKIPFKW